MNPKNQPVNNPNQNSNVKSYVLGEVEGSTTSDRRYLCRIQVGEKQIREFNSKLYDYIVSEALNNYSNEG